MCVSGAERVRISPLPTPQNPLKHFCKQCRRECSHPPRAPSSCTHLGAGPRAPERTEGSVASPLSPRQTAQVPRSPWPAWRGYMRPTDPPTSSSRVQARCVPRPPLTWHPEAGGVRIPRPAAGRAAADGIEARRLSSRVGRGTQRPSQHLLRKQSGRRAAPHQLKPPVPPPPAPVAGRPAWAEGALCIKAAVTSRGAGAAEALAAGPPCRGRALRPGGLGTRAAGAGPR